MYMDDNEAVAEALARTQDAGIELDALAMKALATLPPDHAVEMLEYVSENAGTLRNPSKYISSTVARGFVPRKGCVAGGASGDALTAAQLAPATQEQIEDMSQLFARADEVGVPLSNEAVNALGTLSPDNASELLEFVIDKHPDLRDPSKYVVSTVARGFKSRRGVDGGRGGCGHSGAPAPPPSGPRRDRAGLLAEALRKVEEAGVELDEPARKALGSLPPEHADEVADYLVMNCDELRNPSNYVSSTVSRGFVSRRGAFGPVSAASGFGDGQSASPLDRRERAAVLAEALRKVEEAGVDLDEPARKALASLPPEHADEIADYLVMNCDNLRNPSNYVSSTVSRGFVPRRGAIGPVTMSLPGRGPAPGAPPTGGHASLKLDPSMVPPDATDLERRVLSLNLEILQGAQQIDFATYLCLRCVPEAAAEELLNTVEAKHFAIASPCNYIQAAVAKIQRGQGFANSGSLAGGKTFGTDVPLRDPQSAAAAWSQLAGAAVAQQALAQQAARARKGAPPHGKGLGGIAKRPRMW